ncbi:MAG: cytochrome c3 family protein [Gallionellaceae bacterium]|nr:cytochrome c3 family protein [Gallionellaceae bacterium]
MQRNCERRWTVPLLALLLLGSGLTYGQMMHPNDPTHSRMHPLNTECATCHVSGRDTTASTAATLIGNQEQLCARCHSNSMQNSHPSGFIPPAEYRIPVRYPLDWRGYITCSTCHEVHSDRSYRLRDNVRGRNMCLACHKQEFFEATRQSGGVHRLAP